MNNINLKRNEIGNCRNCGKSPEGEEFRGRFSSRCTHMESQGGWWLRIDHHENWLEPENKPKDTVGELLCPDCLKEYNEKMTEFLGL